MNETNNTKMRLADLGRQLQRLQAREDARARRRAMAARWIRRTALAASVAAAAVPVASHALEEVPNVVSAGDPLTAEEYNENLAHLADGISAVELAAPRVPGTTSATQIVAGKVGHDGLGLTDSYSLGSTQVGDWVAAVIRDDEGIVRLVAEDGVFSDRPICTCSHTNSFGGVNHICRYQLNNSSATELEFRTSTSDETGTYRIDRAFQFMCIGPAGDG